jgi:5'-nucleotidase
MKKDRPQILLVNDDGIRSPGLWAAAEALSTLGFVTVIAPRSQYSGAGRSMGHGVDGKIEATQLKIGSQEWTTYSVNGSPAQATQAGIHEILKRLPDLIVSGINYGENPSHDITMSGTVGAAIEGAAHGVPALAVSLELLNEEWFSYSTEVNFSTAAYFTHKFAEILLNSPLPRDVDLLNLNVPYHATPETPWKMTRLSRNRYFNPFLRPEPSEYGPIDSAIRFDPDDPSDVDSDVHVFKVEHLVSVTPLSLDMTSRVNLGDLENQFKGLVH